MIRPALVFLALFTVFFGIIYPGFCTICINTLFPWQAEGSFITDKCGNIIGSEHIGQHFSEAKYFWGRLSSTSPNLYNAAASSGSNYSSHNPKLLKAIEARIKALQSDSNTVQIPVDLVTSSASGLDPHISLASALYQIPRVAKARNMSVDEIKEIIKAHTQGRQFGVLGEPRVNVLKLNLALDGKL